MLPDEVRRAIEHTLGGGEIVGAERVGGGCISPAARIEDVRGRTFFVKWVRGGEPDGFFEAEARGLEALRAADAVRVPDVVAVHARWLLLEWLPAGSVVGSTWPGLGRALAALHAWRAGEFGATEDNFIGPLPQSNARSGDWPSFWCERRIRPQLERARGAFTSAHHARFEHFLEDVAAILLAAGNEDGPSLLHGDLWSGNVHITKGGDAALIDPSVYRGHREVDLAMADLFGGFDRTFFDAYSAEWPLQAGWRERRAAYQLYYLLVHVNLFGTGYVARTLRALEAAGG